MYRKMIYVLDRIIKMEKEMITRRRNRVRNSNNKIDEKNENEQRQQ